MDLKERAEKLEALMKDKENVKALLSNETPEEAQAWLKERGLEFSIEELNELGATLKGVAEGKIKVEDLKNAVDRELSDDELEAAAGGLSTAAVAGFVVTITSILDGIDSYLSTIDWPSW